MVGAAPPVEGDVLILFGAYDNGSGPSFFMALPEIAWEASLAIYCAWKGFRPSPIAEPRMAMA
jgi:hypothetical protein